MSTSTTSDEGLASALCTTLLDLTRIASPIGEEMALCDHVQAHLLEHLPAGAVQRHGHSLVVHAVRRPGKPRIALVGHLDVVRTEHDGPARVEGSRLFGPGAADMKSGLAVMLELIERIDLASLPCDLMLVFYEGEEGPYEENALGELLLRFEDLSRIDLALCLEPSDNKLQLGCMGSVHVTLRFEGRTAHSARPWQGENAILKAADVLLELRDRAPRDVVVDGCVFREVVSPTLASAGRSHNIVPDLFEVNLNYRFAPGRTPAQVVSEIEHFVGQRAKVEPTDLSPACRPHRDHFLVKHLAQCGVRATEVKQAWTGVARFDQIGVAAVNFGPGTQAQAHQRNEYTELAPLEEGYRVLEQFLKTIPEQ